MSNKGEILLCDIGGTHARFARLAGRGAYDHFKKYRLCDFNAFADIVHLYIDETGLCFSEARFSTALVPVNDILSYKRYSDDPDLYIDFHALAKECGWDHWIQKMDSQSGGLGLRIMQADMSMPVIAADIPPLNSHRILVAVGTGIYHALINDESVSTMTDGHFLAVTVTDEQRAVENFIRRRKDQRLSVNFEDFVSARGLRMITEFVSGHSTDTSTPNAFIQDLQNHPDAIRLFYEFLGLYAHLAVTISGHYGGLYLTGGVIDNLIKADLTDWDSFQKYLRPPMLPVVNDRLGSVGIHYVLHDELPLLGLTGL